MAEAVEHLLHNLKDLSSNLSTAKTKLKNKMGVIIIFIAQSY
jgi:hypothetical protein